MHTVEFISERYLSFLAWRPGSITLSRPVEIERRVITRRVNSQRREEDHIDDVERLLKAAFPL